MIFSTTFKIFQKSYFSDTFSISRNRQEGSVLVEVSVTFLIFLFFIFLIFDGAIFMYNQVAAEYMAGSAARYAITRGTDALAENVKTDLPADDNTAKEEIISFIKNKYILFNCNKDKLKVEVTFSDGTVAGGSYRDPGDKVEVVIEITYKSVLPMVSELLAATTRHKSQGVYTY